jgi:thiamine-phosphate pyrophosphorylase
MARAQPAKRPRPAAQLYLITPVIEAAPTFAQTLANALPAAGVAAVLMRLHTGDERTLINLAKQLAPVTQKAGAALVLDGHADIAARAGADGAHTAGIEAFDAAVHMLKPDRIVGCGGLITRHDAMLAAEHGADYVMFGEPDIEGRRPSFEAVVERIAWWAEVFEVPCVAYAATLDEISPLVDAGADFIAFGDPIWGAPNPAAALTAAAERLTLPEPVA